MEKKNLDEISFMRPILILMLITYHSFAPWNGDWPEFICQTENNVYEWIAACSYSFMLPLFVFISGYVYSYQTNFLKRSYTIQTLVKNKAKRLLYPSVLFSLIYILLELDEEYVFDIHNGGG